jgi:hypothetical protein
MFNSKVQDVNNFSEDMNTTSSRQENVDIQDQQSFEELLTQDTLSDGSLGGNIMQGFMHVTNNVQYYKNSANTAIKKASMNPEIENIMKMMTKMHEYSKEVTVSSRVLNKATQAVDQLTKLQ